MTVVHKDCLRCGKPTRLCLLGGNPKHPVEWRCEACGATSFEDPGKPTVTESDIEWFGRTWEEAVR